MSAIKTYTLEFIRGLTRNIKIINNNDDLSTYRFVLTVKKVEDIREDNEEALLIKEWTGTTTNVYTTDTDLTPEETNFPAGVYKFDIRAYSDELDRILNCGIGQWIQKDNVNRNIILS